MRLNRRGIVTAACVLAAVLLATGQAAFAGSGPPSGNIYAHDELYRTVVTPADLPPNGPFDTIYVLGNGLASVSDAAPGDPGYNGGRWEVRLVTFVNIPPTQFTNAEQVQAAAAGGDITTGDVVRRFVCTLNRIP